MVITEVALVVGGQEQQQHQTDTTTTATPSQSTPGALSTEATTGGNNSGGPSDATDGAPINQLTAQAIRHTGQGKIVVQNNDDQGASRNLNLALDQLENM